MSFKTIIGHEATTKTIEELEDWAEECVALDADQEFMDALDGYINYRLNEWAGTLVPKTVDEHIEWYASIRNEDS